MAAVDCLVWVLHHIATSDSYTGSWQFSIPTFVDRGSVTPPSVLPMSTYLLNDDCISFIMMIVFVSVSLQGFMINVMIRSRHVTMSIVKPFCRQFLMRQTKAGVFQRHWQMINVIFFEIMSNWSVLVLHSLSFNCLWLNDSGFLWI